MIIDVSVEIGKSLELNSSATDLINKINVINGIDFILDLRSLFYQS